MSESSTRPSRALEFRRRNLAVLIVLLAIVTGVGALGMWHALSEGNPRAAAASQGGAAS